MTTPESMRDEFIKLFGIPFNSKQLWLMAKFAKYVRLRARNNTAFNNLANKVFPYSIFDTITKTKQNGQTYPGLRITCNSEIINEDENEE